MTSGIVHLVQPERPMCKTCGIRKGRVTGKYKNGFTQYKQECHTCYSRRTRGLLLDTVPTSPSKVCEVCETEDKLCFDHDHKTGVFRGVLCRSCNLAIGSLRNRVDLAENAANYLRRESTINSLLHDEGD